MSEQTPNQEIPPQSNQPNDPNRKPNTNFPGNLFGSNNVNGYNTAQNQPGMLTTLTNAKGRIGIIGIIIVVAAAYALNINPMNALAFFSGNSNQNQPAYQQTTQPPQTR